MIDHIIAFADEAAAIETLIAYRTAADEETPAGWRGDCTIPNIIMSWTDGAVEIITDPAGEEESYEQIKWTRYPGWYILITTDEMIEELRDLPDNACRIILDRNSGEVLYHASDADEYFSRQNKIEPVFAGSDYVFMRPGRTIL